MKKKEYKTPDFETSNYTPMMVVAMSWSDEETGEALTPSRGDYNTDWEEDFWEGREQTLTHSVLCSWGISSGDFITGESSGNFFDTNEKKGVSHPLSCFYAMMKPKSALIYFPLFWGVLP